MAGQLFVLTGPSGAGKGTLHKRYLERAEGVVLVVSYTTRNPRAGEVGGVDYNYVTRDQFLEMILRNMFLEYALYGKNYYGTPRQEVVESLKEADVLLEIECQGAIQIRQNCPEAILIFCMTPTFEELERRLRERGTESEEEILARLAKAREEVNLAETADLFDYLIVTDDLETEIREFQNIREKHSLPVRL